MKWVRDTLNWDEIRSLLAQVAHLSHQDWKLTGSNSQRLGDVLLKDGMSASTSQMLERILTEGNWKGAEDHAAASHDSKPWAVLVTGVNGIRKTTSIYQPWFPALLKEALLSPPDSPTQFAEEVLPSGSISFFRQVDHMS